MNFGEPPRREVRKEGRAGKMERGRGGVYRKPLRPFTGYYAGMVVGAFIARLDRGYAYFGEQPFYAVG